MAKKSNNNLLLIAAVAVGGYFLWKKSAAPAVAPATGLTPTLTGDYSTAPTIGTGSASTPLPSTANDPRLIEINQWVGTLSVGNQNQARAALSQMSQAEIAGLYDIVHNDFYGNGITTPTQRVFWDTWRVKYHVLDGTVA
jgi:predicted membrane-bound mannosyltransferase